MFPQATLSKPAKGSVVSQSSQFRKWPKKVSKMATILLLLLLADATTYCAKKNWI